MAEWTAFCSQANADNPEETQSFKETKSFKDIELKCVFKVIGARKVATRFGVRVVVSLEREKAPSYTTDRWCFPRLQRYFLNENNELKRKHEWPHHIGFTQTEPSYHFHTM